MVAVLSSLLVPQEQPLPALQNGYQSTYALPSWILLKNTQVCGQCFLTEHLEDRREGHQEFKTSVGSQSESYLYIEKHQFMGKQLEM